MILEIIILPGLHETYDGYMQRANLLSEKLKNNKEIRVTCGNYNISRRDNVINLISEAKGQYILFTTTSYKISNKLQSLISFCKANEFDLGFFQCYRVNDKGRKIYFSQNSKKSYTKKDNFINLNINSYVFSIKTLKKSTIRELDIDFDYFMIADAINKVSKTTVIPIDVETDEYMLKSMKRQYPFGFEMAAIAADYIADIYNLSMKENDLIYLAIHFQAAIERMKDAGEKTKIIIVCHFGAAAARIIRSKIERKLVGVEVTGMYSLQEFKQLKNPDCDYIVTTERILKADFPIIYI